MFTKDILQKNEEKIEKLNKKIAALALAYSLKEAKVRQQAEEHLAALQADLKKIQIEHEALKQVIAAQEQVANSNLADVNSAENVSYIRKEA